MSHERIWGFFKVCAIQIFSLLLLLSLAWRCHWEIYYVVNKFLPGARKLAEVGLHFWGLGTFRLLDQVGVADGRVVTSQHLAGARHHRVSFRRWWCPPRQYWPSSDRAVSETPWRPAPDGWRSSSSLIAPPTDSSFFDLACCTTCSDCQTYQQTWALSDKVLQCRWKSCSCPNSSTVWPISAIHTLGVLWPLGLSWKQDKTP